MSSPPNLTEEPWNPNEFVVALPDLPVVRAELDNLPQPIELTEEPKKSQILDLALIKITNVAAVVQRINDQLGPGRRRECRTAQPEYAIDRVIRAIRENCQDLYGGWTPTVGKNRTLDGVHTTQHVGTGRAAGYPSPATAADLGVLSTNGTEERAVVGVVDTALWANPKLKGRYQEDEPDIFLAPAEQQRDTAGHATFVAGMILQDSPNVELRVRKALEPDGTALAWNVAEEMVQLAKSVDVLNVSFACFTEDNEEPLILARAIELIDRDKVIVAAAGNFGDIVPRNDGRTPTSPKSPMWPAASSLVTAVGAHGRDGLRAEFSPDAPWVDLTARGVEVGSLYLEGMVEFQEFEGLPRPDPKLFGGYATWTGTSFAAGMASGAIARRITRGTRRITAREALNEVMKLPPGNADQVWPNPRP